MNSTTNSTVSTTIASSTITTNVLCAGPTWENDVYFALLLLFVPIIFIGNLAVIVVVFYTRTLRNQPMYIFLASLAVADCLIGVFLFPLRAKNIKDGLRFELPTGLCWLFWLCDPLINIVSILHFVVVAVDRYISLKYAYNYSTMMTRKRAIIVILLIWLFSTLWTVLNVPQWTTLYPGDFPIQAYKVSIYNTERTGCGWWNPNFHIVTLVLWVLLPISLLIFLYTFIYRTALRHVKEISRLSRLRSEDANQVRWKKQLQLIRSILVVFVTYALCWVPLAVYTLWTYHNLKSTKRLFCSRKTWFKVVTFICAQLLTVVCPSTNPFIYVLTNAAFVTALQRMIYRVTGIKLGKKDSIIQSTTKKQNDSVGHSYKMKDLVNDGSVGENTGNDHRNIAGTLNDGITSDNVS